MTPTHTDPTKPRIDKDGRQHWARAPYNFVPLPEKMVKTSAPLPLDIYHPDGFTGWIDCELETCSPTYVRGMVNAGEYSGQNQDKNSELPVSEKIKRAPFYSGSTTDIEGYPTPSIPGSSLRGMVRALVEIVGFGRMRWVGNKPAFTYRAVAAPKDDPLRDPYRNVIGAFGRNVRAGYLEKKGEDWYVRPALTPQRLGWPGKETYLKVKERTIGSKDIPGFLRLDSPDYHPQLHKVSFDVKFGRSQQGPYISVTQIGPRDANYSNKGVLVCSGNMIESGQVGQRSPRRNHALILEADKNANTVKINPHAINDYMAGITAFQSEELKDWHGDPGCLREGNPVFFVTETGVDNQEEVSYFGYSPNFRIPACQSYSDGKRAARPQDFIPSALRDQLDPDLADVLFGWIEERNWGPKAQHAGRVYFSDAQYLASTNGVWLKPDPITPHVLAGPKATTFQNYLVQDRNSGHDPDTKVSLAHFGSSPKETQIRGFKRYWLKGAMPSIEANSKEREHEKQLTRIVPLKPGVRFAFRIGFDNLRQEELGALLWVLNLPGSPEKKYCHQIGMGKPLGMGAVAISTRLFITDRGVRYSRLFNGDSWQDGVANRESAPFQDAFESFILEKLEILHEKKHLSELDRIGDLLTMMEWHESDDKWADWTRYMEIERGVEKVNEYKERPVLPTPKGVLTLAAGGIPSAPLAVSGRGAGKSGAASNGNTPPRHTSARRAEDAAPRPQPARFVPSAAPVRQAPPVARERERVERPVVVEKPLSDVVVGDVIWAVIEKAEADEVTLIPDQSRPDYDVCTSTDQALRRFKAGKRVMLVIESKEGDEKTGWLFTCSSAG